MSQLTLDAALASVELNAGDWIQWARGEAQSISLTKGCVTSDDVRARCDLYGLQPDSPHAWGALFKCKGFVCIVRRRSEYPTSNGRFISVWRYAPEAHGHV